MRSWLSAFLLWGIYPVWLLAGAGDYFCHRRTGIERTSGATESWLHLAQFGCLAIAFACAVLVEISVPVFVAMVLLVLTHSVLAYIDARYTEPRRRILPIEQTIHGFMDVLPLVAIALLGAQYWQETRAGSITLARVPSVGLERVLLVASFLVLAGLPILEELLRGLRHHKIEDRNQGQKSHNAERDPPSQKAPVPNR